MSAFGDTEHSIGVKSYSLNIFPERKSTLKEINPEYLLDELMLNLKLQYLVHLLWRAGLLEKTLMLGKIEGRRR